MPFNQKSSLIKSKSNDKVGPSNLNGSVKMNFNSSMNFNAFANPQNNDKSNIKSNFISKFPSDETLRSTLLTDKNVDIKIYDAFIIDSEESPSSNED